MTARLLAEQEVLDLNVEDPPIEDVIELVFARRQRRARRNPFVEDARSYVDFYLTVRTQVSSQFQYRRGVHVPGMVAEP